MRRFLILSLVLIAAAGCKDEDPVAPVPPGPTIPFAGSPEQAMANFRTAYETLDPDLFATLLSPDFEMFLQPETIDQFPDVGQTLDRDEMLRIHERMFSGEDQTDPNGAFVPGLASITFGVFTPLDEWQTSLPGDEVPGALFAPYQLEFLCSRGQAYSQVHEVGPARFYVAARDSLFEGEVRDYYELVGIVDQTLGSYKATEQECWGSFLALFR